MEKEDEEMRRIEPGPKSKWRGIEDGRVDRSTESKSSLFVLVNFDFNPFDSCQCDGKFKVYSLVFISTQINQTQKDPRNDLETTALPRCISADAIGPGPIPDAPERFWAGLGVPCGGLLFGCGGWTNGVKDKKDFYYKGAGIHGP